MLPFPNKYPLLFMLLGIALALSCFLAQREIAQRSQREFDELSAEFNQLKTRVENAKRHGAPRGFADALKPQVNEIGERLDGLRQEEREAARTRSLLNFGTLAGLLLSCLGNLVYLRQRAEISRQGTNEH